MTHLAGETTNFFQLCLKTSSTFELEKITAPVILQITWVSRDFLS